MSKERDDLTRDIVSLQTHAAALSNAWSSGAVKRIALNIDYMEGVLRRAKSQLAKDLYKHTLTEAMHTERLGND